MSRVQYTVPAEIDILSRLLTPAEPATAATLLDEENNCFPSGLLPYVSDRLAEADMDFILDGVPEKHISDFDNPVVLSGITLEPFQVGAVRDILTARRGVLHIGTGGGKTEILLAVLKHLEAPALIVTSRVLHAENMYDRLLARGFKSVGFIGDSRKTLGWITVAIVDSLYRELSGGSSKIMSAMQQVQVLVADEAHRSAAMRSVAIGLSSPAPYRIFMSATPFDDKRHPYGNEHDMAIIGLSGPVLCRVPLSYLTKLGRTVPVQVHNISMQDPPMNSRNHYYPAVYQRGIVENQVRNAIGMSLVASLTANPYNRVLVLVKIIEHGRILLDLLHRLGVDTVFHSGGGQILTCGPSGIQESQMDVHQQFSSGAIGAVVGSTIYDEAVDIPGITDIVLMGADKKAARQEQRVGRGVRCSPGKTCLRVWDFTDEHHWMLKNQHKKRKLVWEDPDNNFTQIPCAPVTMIAPHMQKLGVAIPIYLSGSIFAS